MKNIIIALFALMPLLSIAQNPEKENGKRKTDISINTDKNGNVEITGISKRELRKIKKEVNKVLKKIDIKTDGGKEKHHLHLKAELK
ncbi:MAG: hypothetical protein JWO06_2529 [Bacteroidota bacterium]|nr:hypothetical protein [Bacteroidota bacterium]